MDSAHRAAYEFADEQGIGADKELIGWLAWVVQDVQDRISQQPVEDVCEMANEIADSSVPIYTHDRMMLMAASNGLACREPESTLGEACAPAQVAGLVLYEVAYDLAVRTADSLDSSGNV
jgi:hypothetical protein